MIDVVNVLRVLMTVSWTYVFLKLAPAAARTVRKRPGPNDIYRMLFWCMSVLMISFGIRWFLFPGAMKAMATPELALWATTYAYSAALARAVSISVRAHDD